MLVPLPDDDDLHFPGDPMAPDPLYDASMPMDGTPIAVPGAFVLEEAARDEPAAAAAPPAASDAPRTALSPRRASDVLLQAPIDMGTAGLFEPERERSKPKRQQSLMPKLRPTMLRMTVYLPDRTPVRVQVHETAIVLDVIGETLRAAKASSGRAGGLRGDVQCYTLRMHDEEGLPDLDFPALDRLRKMRHFATATSGNDYCLEVDAGAMAVWAATADELSPKAKILILVPLSFAPEPGEVGAPRRSARRRSSASRPPPRPVTVPAGPESTVSDVLATALERAGVRPNDDVFRLLLTEADQSRLRLPGRELPPELLATALLAEGVSVLHLDRRAFADEIPTASAVPGMPGAAPVQALLSTAPRLAPALGGMGGAQGRAGAAADGEAASGAGGDNGSATRRASRVLRAAQHTIVTASQFEQWRVVKINNAGRRQPRVLGVDISRVTNTKLPGESRGWLASSTTRVAERLMSDLARVEMPPAGASEEATRSLALTFNEGMDLVTLKYVCEAPEDRQQIVAKLTYILKLNGEGHKVVQL